MISVAGVALDVYEHGKGVPLLYFHGGGGIALDLPFLDRLAKNRRVIAPSHPGFGKSSLPDWLDSIDDVVHIYLELMDIMSLARVDVIGFSIGGWIAADLASKAPERIMRLALIGPVGVKTGPPDALDVPDIFAMPDDQLDRLRFHDPRSNPVNFSTMSDPDLNVVARNRETLALLTWEPYMHNPKLNHRLHRVTAQTLFMRGESDGIVSADYLDRYAKLLPKAEIETIAEAGHLPHVEQLEVTATKVLDFLKY